MAFPTNAVQYSQPVHSGIVLQVYPSTDANYTVELARMTSASTWATIAQFGGRQYVGPFQYRDILPNDAYERTYRARNTRTGYTASGWTATVTAAPVVLPDDTVPAADEGRRRSDTLYLNDGIFQPSVGQHSGGEVQAMMTGHQSGSVNGGKVSGGAWVNGPLVTFPTSYAAPPIVRLHAESNAISYQPNAIKWTSSSAYSATVAQAMDLTALNVTKTGFTPRARLAQASTALTLRTKAYSTGNALTVGQSTAVTTTAAPSYNDGYQASYSVSMVLQVPTAQPTITTVVAVDCNSTGGFTERGTQSYQASLNSVKSPATAALWASEVLQFAVAGVSSTEQVRVRHKSLQVQGASTDAVEVTVHAVNVTYYTPAAGGIYAAMCPSTNDVVTWIAYSGAATT